ncbi:hypothetical protein GCM10018781_29680 [Kitasatospora indigofera]|uniref:Uncharacterized protein n=1 Tax=Kitasatospora indigofera TaxID=67307 RepID=A0A919FQL3_9ACTN|nr:hypothetical protein GCM10018781_29680 [Kitasatospora indigofera]
MDDVTPTNGANSTDRQHRDGDRDNGGGPPGTPGRSAAGPGGSRPERRPAAPDAAAPAAGAVSRG